MRRTIALLFVVSLPWAISAEPIYVDYRGSVRTLHSDGDPITDFFVGQSFSGRLTIDTKLAGPDENDPYPGYGFWSNPGIDFITGGPETMPIGSPADQITSEPYGPRPNRYFQIIDRSAIDVTDQNSSTFSLFVKNLPHELSDDRLAKAFRAEPAKDGSFISASLLRIKNGVQSSIQFAIDKLSVTPGSCLAP